jgi:Ice-binding-like
VLSDQSRDSRTNGTSTRVNRGGISLKLMAASVGLLLLITASLGNAFASMPVAPLAATAPTLGNAQSFGVLGGTTVTNTGPSVIMGNLGVSPGASVIGFPPGSVIGGTIHRADALSLQAQTDVTTAYNALAAQTCTTTFTPPTDLVGKTLVPGVYCFGSTAALTGVLTLDGQNDPSAVWVFKIGTAITTASGSSIVFIRSGSGCNVYWQVTSSATIGTTSKFAGNILALTTITLATGARLTGRALARTGVVTLDSNTISGAACSAGFGATATAAAGVAATATAATAATATATAGVAATATAAAAATATATAGVAPTATAAAAATETAVAAAPTQCVGNIRGQKVDGAGHGLAGWTIQLLQGGQVIQTAVTDSSGNFNFLGLGMGAYAIQEVPQNGWVAQSPSSINVTLGACDQNLTGNTFVNAAASSGGSAALTATAVAASSGGSAALTATAAARSAAAGTPTATAVVPTGLPRTGDSPTQSGLFGLLFGALLVLMGVGIFRRSHR